jgi:hypothetical protein
MKKILTILMLCGVMNSYAQNTPPHAASKKTWVIKANGVTQIWSDHVNLPDCNKADYHGYSVYSGEDDDCRKNVTGRYYLYSFYYVFRHAKKLCPSPWRVPTKKDFVVVVNSTDDWGGVNGGTCDDKGNIYDFGSEYWSKTKADEFYGWYYDATARRVNTISFVRGKGVRCVR